MKFLFLISGAKFYMDWLLITNPLSKNPIIKFLWGWMKPAYSGKNYKNRFKLSIQLFSVHILMLFLDLITKKEISIVWEMLYNIYPMIVQFYIGYRCWEIIKWKKELKNKVVC